ncbi:MULTISPECIES: hypothetical protein [unclassified Dyella]|uniref:hypothetical protein n=1 Tax=Dyella sp. ASV21 TaxID=2795114 RepID=UPI0018EC14B6|nr:MULTISPECIES: hypothetical protein [unclassified Dyella]
MTSDDMKANRLAMIRAAAGEKPPAPLRRTGTGKARGPAVVIPPRFSTRHRALSNTNFSVIQDGGR